MHTGVVVLLLLSLIGALTYLPSILAVDCPSRTYGNNPANTIKYFSSPLCVPCWYQKAELEKLAATHGDSFLVEEYDADFCANAAAPQRVMGTPSFLINGTMRYGFQTQEMLLEEIA